jgi:hypothetical protein
MDGLRGVLPCGADDHRRAWTLDVDVEDHGYKRLNTDPFEHGLYGGQSANPKAIGEALEACKVTRYVFTLDSVGQFDARFSVYVHESEWTAGLADRLADAETDGPDPAEGMKRALRNIPPAPPGDGVAVTKVDCGTGTATTQRVSREDFARGWALDVEEEEE